MRSNVSRPPAVLVLALLGLFALASASAARPGGRHADRFAALERGVESLELAEDTRSEVFAAIDAGRVAARELRSELRAAHRGLRDLLQAESPDPAEVMAQAEILGAITTEYRKQELATLLSVLALLPPEERAALQARREERRGRSAEGRAVSDDAAEDRTF